MSSSHLVKNEDVKNYSFGKNVLNSAASKNQSVSQLTPTSGYFLDNSAK